MLSNIRRQEHKVGAGLVTRGVLTANAAIQLREIILSA
jgi:hypothetical protein